MRIKGWSTLSSPELYKVWLEQFQSIEEAEATAIWIANRLVKSAARSTRRKFYEVKNFFLERYQSCLIEGRFVREEDSGRVLYIHHLEIAGRKYSFHAYSKPSKLSELPGENLESYGGRFSDDELTQLQLPLSGLVRLLRYAAFAIWMDSSTSSTVILKPAPRLSCHCENWPGRPPGAHHPRCRMLSKPAPIKELCL